MKEKQITMTTDKKAKLVVFDVEGVLIPKNRFFFLLGKALGPAQTVKILLFGLLYETGLIPLKTAISNLFRSARGMKIETLLGIATSVPIVPQAQTVFESLKEQGYKTALITSGLPTIAVKIIAGSLGADYVFGFEVGTDSGVLTGEIWGDVIEKDGKLSVLRKLLSDKRLYLNDCVVVADDRNNTSIFLPEVVKIGFNPDFLLRVKSDHIVAGNISRVLAAISGEPKSRRRPSRNDILRESIHALGFFVPVIAALISIQIVVASILLILGAYLASEYLRIRGKRMPIFNFITRKAASQYELYQIVLAPVYFAVGILLTLLIFPAPASNAAIAIFSLGDSTASLFGTYFSSTPLPLNKGKSLEGSAVGFLFAFLAGLFFVPSLVAIIGAAVAMLVEYLPLPINDNLLIPLFTGLALTFLV